MERSKNLITKRKIYGFSTVVTLNKSRGDTLLTDGKINETSPLVSRFNDKVTGQKALLIEECTYAVYTNGDEIIVETRDSVDNTTIANLLLDIEKKMPGRRTI